MLLRQFFKLFSRHDDFKLLRSLRFDLAFFSQLRLVPSDASRRCLAAFEFAVHKLENFFVRLAAIQNHVRDELANVHFELSVTNYYS